MLSRLHAVDLVNKYTIDDLDLRELRALYAVRAEALFRFACGLCVFSRVFLPGKVERRDSNNASARRRCRLSSRMTWTRPS